jgi:hypothetical protein
MEVDIEVRLNSFSRLIALELAKHFPVEFPQTDIKTSHQNVIIRSAPKPQVVPDVDTGIRDFLRSLTTYAETIKQSQGTLRIGIFYNLCETVAFPFRLSIETVKLLCELNLSVDATGYPCADEPV